MLKKLPIPEAEILAALDTSKKTDGWASQSELGSHLQRVIADFAPKKFGYTTFSRLIEAMPVLETRKSAGNGVYVRRK